MLQIRKTTEENKSCYRHRQVKNVRLSILRERNPGALHKAWKGYVIAKNKDEYDKMLHYADIIQELQDNLGLRVSSFPDMGKSVQ